jgi:hypothetical protein
MRRQTAGVLGALISGLVACSFSGKDDPEGVSSTGGEPNPMQSTTSSSSSSGGLGSTSSSSSSGSSSSSSGQTSTSGSASSSSSSSGSTTSSSSSSSGTPNPLARAPKGACTASPSDSQFVALVGAGSRIARYNGVPDGKLGASSIAAVCNGHSTISLNYPTALSGEGGPAILAGVEDRNGVTISYTVEETISPGGVASLMGPFVQMDVGEPASILGVRVGDDGTVFVEGRKLSGPGSTVEVGRPTAPYVVQWTAAKGAQGITWSISIRDRFQTFTKNGSVLGSGGKTDFWYGLNRETAGESRLTVSDFSFNPN